MSIQNIVHRYLKQRQGRTASMMEGMQIDPEWLAGITEAGKSWSAVLNPPSEHYIEKCSVCGTTVSRCRCLGPHVIRYTICDECKAKT